MNSIPTDDTAEKQTLCTNCKEPILSTGILAPDGTNVCSWECENGVWRGQQLRELMRRDSEAQAFLNRLSG